MLNYTQRLLLTDFKGIAQRYGSLYFDSILACLSRNALIHFLCVNGSSTAEIYLEFWLVYRFLVMIKGRNA